MIPAEDFWSHKALCFDPLQNQHWNRSWSDWDNVSLNMHYHELIFTLRPFILTVLKGDCCQPFCKFASKIGSLKYHNTTFDKTLKVPLGEINALLNYSLCSKEPYIIFYVVLYFYIIYHTCFNSLQKIHHCSNFNVSIRFFFLLLKKKVNANLIRMH